MAKQQLTPEQTAMKNKARRFLDKYLQEVRLFGAGGSTCVRRDLSPAGDFYFVSVFDSAGNDYEVKFLHHHDNKIYFEGIRDVKAPTIEDAAREYLLDLLSKRGTYEVAKMRYGAQTDALFAAARKLLKPEAA